MTCNHSVRRRRFSAFLLTARALLWGFLGVRRHSDYQKDVAQLHPLHVIFTGIVLAFLFVIILIFVVHWVVA